MRIIRCIGSRYQRFQVEECIYQDTRRAEPAEAISTTQKPCRSTTPCPALALDRLLFLESIRTMSCVCCAYQRTAEMRPSRPSFVCNLAKLRACMHANGVRALGGKRKRYEP